MYRNLVKISYSHQLRNKFNWLVLQTASEYHNGSAYYGYRPKPEQDWKGKKCFCLIFATESKLNRTNKIQYPVTMCEIQK